MAGIDDVLAEQAPALMEIPGVTGVGQGEADGKECILVMVSHRAKEVEEAIPTSLAGYPVVIQFTGPLEAHHQK